MNNLAHHYIKVDGVSVSYTRVADADYVVTTGTTTLVLPLQTGQELAVDPGFTGGIQGSATSIRSSFSATLLYAH